MNVGGVSNPSTSVPMTWLKLGLAGPRIDCMPCSTSHARAASNRAWAASGSFKHSKKPKNPRSHAGIRYGPDSQSPRSARIPDCRDRQGTSHPIPANRKDGSRNQRSFLVHSQRRNPVRVAAIKFPGNWRNAFFCRRFTTGSTTTFGMAASPGVSVKTWWSEPTIITLSGQELGFLPLSEPIRFPLFPRSAWERTVIQARSHRSRENNLAMLP